MTSICKVKCSKMNLFRKKSLDVNCFWEAKTCSIILIQIYIYVWHTVCLNILGHEAEKDFQQWLSHVIFLIRPHWIFQDLPLHFQENQGHRTTVLLHTWPAHCEHTEVRNSCCNTVTSSPLNVSTGKTLFQAFHITSAPFFPLRHVEKVWGEHSELAFTNLHAWWSPVAVNRSVLAAIWHSAWCWCVSEVEQRHLLFIISKRGGGKEGERGRNGERGRRGSRGKRVSVY